MRRISGTREKERIIVVFMVISNQNVVFLPKKIPIRKRYKKGEREKEEVKRVNERH